MGWQKTFSLPELSKGCHVITDDVVNQISDGIKDVKVGMLFLFIQHSSAALSISEKFDQDVPADMEMALDAIVPETLQWRRTHSGKDESVAPTKATLVGSTVSVPIKDGSLNLGSWQDVYLLEFIHTPQTRNVVATVLS
ncbi:hypothetical protein EV363DRAFT_1337122 [Boletus edulis]|uniref:Secondary thiamine-phosphate synthase enzyme n=1 Tax=Boletus edulis BED1 TaxID=1328754 RepID=A0AAD4BN81_BOLED|nr:hypothetical protein EV363DRAFT_1337122 [Boletus edulis]KAF8435340.1 hypothetical protein L210DRAFT_3550877 [Boletus edulis BED1]